MQQLFGLHFSTKFARKLEGLTVCFFIRAKSKWIWCTHTRIWNPKPNVYPAKRAEWGGPKSCCVQFSFESTYTRTLCSFLTRTFWYRHEDLSYRRGPADIRRSILRRKFSWTMRKLKLLDIWRNFSCIFKPASFSCEFCRAAIQLHLSFGAHFPKL